MAKLELLVLEQNGSVWLSLNNLKLLQFIFSGFVSKGSDLNKAIVT